MENLSLERMGAEAFPSSKLSAPRLPDGCAALEGACELIEDALAGNALILVAPSGCGKTAFLASWAARWAPQAADATTRVSWIRLDAGDGDFARFRSLLVAGLEAFVPDLGRSLREVRESGRSATVADELIVAIERCERPWAFERNVLVLDNYEAVDNRAVDDLLDYLIAYLPLGMKLVVSGRRMPALFVASQAPGGGELVTVVTHERLGLDDKAAADYLSALLGGETGLPDDALSAVLRAAGGRIPSLNLAARLIGERRRGAGGPFAFDAGELRLLMDALFASLAEPERDLLVKTAFLDIVSPPLCDCVLKIDGSEGLIASIAARTGALVPVDGKRGWYEIPGVWSQYLQAKFRKLERAAVRELCKRASVHLRNGNRIGQAIDCLRKAALWEDLDDVVGEHHLALMFDNRFDVFKDALAKLPLHVLESSPKLSIAQAWVLVKAGAVEEAMRYVRLSESLADEESPEAAQLEAERLAVRSLCCGHSGDLQAGKDMIARLLRRDQDDPGVFASLIYNAAGCIVAREKEPDRVIGYLENCLEVAASQGNKPACSVLCYFAARQCIDAGDLRRAEAVARRPRDRVAGLSAGEGEFDALSGVIRGTVMRKRGEFERAELMYSRCLESLDLSSGIEFLSEAMCGLALAQRSQGKADQAAQTVRSVLRLCDGQGAERPKLIALVYLTMIEADAGDVDGAEGHARTLRGAKPASADLLGDLIALALARVRFAKGSLDEARRSIDALAGNFERSNRDGLLLSALVAKSMVHHAGGQRGPSFQAALEALALASRSGEIEPFVNEGFAMVRLLGELEERRLLDEEPAALARTITRMITALNIPEPAWRLEKRGRSPLTAREHEVCELLALGYSNREIAESLCVSINTVDTHRKRIYAKLGVGNRKDLISKLNAPDDIR